VIASGRARSIGRLEDGLKRRAGHEARLLPQPFLTITDVDRDRRGSLHDVGCGVSQVLPVVAHALAADGQVVAIEQPELHLHPSAQADLGDLFITASRKGKPTESRSRFLLETHSEHLILRILRRIRETTQGRAPDDLQIKASEVSVLFVSPSAEGAWVTYLPISEDGDFTEPWPEGFLPDRLKEL
jgi:predicted ATPase